MRSLWIQRLALCVAFCCVGWLRSNPPLFAIAQAGNVVAVVDGVKITDDDVDSYCRILGIDAPSSEVRQSIRETLVDRVLLDKFLQRKKAEVDPAALDLQLGAFVSVAEHTQQPLADLLAKRGLTQEELEKSLALDLKWQDYARKSITPQQVKIFFEKNKIRFDGTRLTASQIFWKLPVPMSDAVLQEKLAAARSLREDIASGKLTFEEAARNHSESPSGQLNGGLLGDFSYYGTMPLEITQIAFATHEGDMSQPFVSTFGIHLLKVQKVQPGNFSLDDAYPTVFEKMSQALKENTVMNLRNEAVVERK